MTPRQYRAILALLWGIYLCNVILVWLAVGMVIKHG